LNMPLQLLTSQRAWARLVLACGKHGPAWIRTSLLIGFFCRWRYHRGLHRMVKPGWADPADRTPARVPR
jgi:hypothetical protein